VANLVEKYKTEIIPALTERFGYTNVMAVPKLTTIVVNVGVGRGDDKERLAQALADVTLVTGQKAVPTKAKTSVASFKIREGMTVGVRVTLRGTQMYEFLDRLIAVGIPRIRDFRGLSPKAFDGRGNFSFGIGEQIVFPEIDPDKIKAAQGMQICFVTTANTDDEARELLRLFGMPFATT
jgi:large subunit ribosomal protein L5